MQPLEESVVALLARVGVAAFGGSGSSSTTCRGRPGVWTTPIDKVCAVGLHVRPEIISFGVELNVHTGLARFRRIVACGLPAHLRAPRRPTSLMPEPTNVSTGVATLRSNQSLH